MVPSLTSQWQESSEREDESEEEGGIMFIVQGKGPPLAVPFCELTEWDHGEEPQIEPVADPSPVEETGHQVLVQEPQLEQVPHPPTLNIASI